MKLPVILSLLLLLPCIAHAMDRSDNASDSLGSIVMRYRPISESNTTTCGSESTLGRFILQHDQSCKSKLESDYSSSDYLNAQLEMRDSKDRTTVARPISAFLIRSKWEIAKTEAIESAAPVKLYSVAKSAGAGAALGGIAGYLLGNPSKAATWGAVLGGASGYAYEKKHSKKIITNPDFSHLITIATDLATMKFYGFPLIDIHTPDNGEVMLNEQFSYPLNGLTPYSFADSCLENIKLKTDHQFATWRKIQKLVEQIHNLQMLNAANAPDGWQKFDCNRGWIIEEGDRSNGGEGLSNLANQDQLDRFFVDSADLRAAKARLGKLASSTPALPASETDNQSSLPSSPVASDIEDGDSLEDELHDSGESIEADGSISPKELRSSNSTADTDASQKASREKGKERLSHTESPYPTTPEYMTDDKGGIYDPNDED